MAGNTKDMVTHNQLDITQWMTKWMNRIPKESWELLKSYVSEVVWIPTHTNLTCLNYTL